MNDQGPNPVFSVSSQASPIEINKVLRNQAVELLLEIANLREKMVLTKTNKKLHPSCQ
jgi:hypothetical protein